MLFQWSVADMTESWIDVYFLRHGIAVPRDGHWDDWHRPLTDRGRRRTRQVAQRLKVLGISFDRLMTSPLVRAVQTAEICCDAHLAETSQVRDALAPGGSQVLWLEWLSTAPTAEMSTLGLIGHEPDLSQWAQQLVHGNVSRGDEWLLKKAGVIGIRVPRHQIAWGSGQLFWLAPPRLML